MKQPPHAYRHWQHATKAGNHGEVVRMECQKLLFMKWHRIDNPFYLLFSLVIKKWPGSTSQFFCVGIFIHKSPIDEDEKIFYLKSVWMGL